MVTTDEVPVVQIDEDADTILERVGALRVGTCSDWPPEPPPPAELEAALAEGTERPLRNAAVYIAVRRPTTSGDGT